MAPLNENIRALRKEKGWTQQDLADRAGIKRSLVGAYEEGRAEPAIEKLKSFADLFGISVDDLVTLDLRSEQPGETPFKVLSITVDPEGRENIELVPQKAAAGYLNGYADPEYIRELPRFRLPFLPDGATYRAFEISGDSMLPLESGTIIIGKYVEQVRDIVSGKTYILVTQQEGIVFKRVFNYLDERGKLFLVSDNKVFSPYDVDGDDVVELWQARAYISITMPDGPSERSDLRMDQLTSVVLSLKDEIESLKGLDKD